MFFSSMDHDGYGTKSQAINTTDFLFSPKCGNVTYALEFSIGKDCSEFVIEVFFA